jgi:hypothetical protein
MGDSPSREYWGAGNDRGNPNANTILPALVDRSLGVTEFKSQQTSEPTDPHRPANLQHPVDGDSDFGAHGAFDDRSNGRSDQWWITSHRVWIYGGALWERLWPSSGVEVSRFLMWADASRGRPAQSAQPRTAVATKPLPPVVLGSPAEGRIASEPRIAHASRSSRRSGQWARR